MKKRVCVVLGGVVVLVVLFAGAAWVGLRSGPTASPPAEDPLARLARERSGLSPNAAVHYLAASIELANPPIESWDEILPADSTVAPPDELIDWVYANAGAWEECRRGALAPHFWVAAQRGDGGAVELPAIEPLRRVARLAALRARIARDGRDAAEYADCMVVLSRLARHAHQQPTLIGYVVAAALDAMLDERILLPLAWPESDADGRLDYATRILGCFEDCPSPQSALREEQDLAAWMYQSGAMSRSGLLRFVGTARFCGELDRCIAPFGTLLGQPLDVQTDPAAPSRAIIAALRTRAVSWLNPSGVLARALVPAFERPIELYWLTEARRRGGRTVVNIFVQRDRTGRLAESLAGLNGASAIDPFSGKPFVFRATEDEAGGAGASPGGFRLYSLGPDRDDDGGRNEPAIARNMGLGRPAADGDLVIWPPK